MCPWKVDLRDVTAHSQDCWPTAARARRELDRGQDGVHREMITCVMIDYCGVIVTLSYSLASLLVVVDLLGSFWLVSCSSQFFELTS